MSFNIVGPRAIRPNPFVATYDEAMKVATDIGNNGLIPLGGTAPSSPDGPNLIKPTQFQIRQPRLNELYFTPEAQTNYQSSGYQAYFLEFVASALQTDNGENNYSADPSNLPGSIFAGQKLPMGMTFYSEVVGILADMLAQIPNGKWYLNTDGSILRR